MYVVQSLSNALRSGRKERCGGKVEGRYMIEERSDMVMSRLSSNYRELLLRSDSLVAPQ